MRVIIIFNSNGIPRERITKIHKYFYLQEIERKSKKKKKKKYSMKLKFIVSSVSCLINI